MGGPARLEERSSAQLDQLAVSALMVTAAQLDGADTLDEAQILAVRSDSSRHLVLLGTDGDLHGYLQVAAPDPRTADVSAGLVVGQAFGEVSRAQIADELLTGAEAASTPGRLVLWSRSDASPIGPAAVGRGYSADRGLLTMSRPLTSADALSVAEPGVVLRPFRPGRDDAAWLALNAAAFADHPEQGAWTATDLHQRMAQPWFDPAGLLLAVDADTSPTAWMTDGQSTDPTPPGTLVGFHWTKLHPGTPPTGEVYVLGTAPAAQGRGIARTLLAAGLAYLQRAGADEVILYVDEANEAAVRLYQRGGFEVFRRQVQYRRP